MKNTQERQAQPTRSPVDPSRVLARDVMQVDVLVFQPDDSIQSAAEQLEENGATGAPVVDSGGRLIGVLTTTDIARGEHVDDAGVNTSIEDPFEADEVSTSDAAGFDEEVLSTPEFGDHVLGRARVADWMTPRVTTVAPEATIGHVCRVMVDEAIHRVFVVDCERLIGIVSTADVVALLATPRDP